MTERLDQDYNQFILNIKRKTGINLSYYKETQMKRRLTSLREKKGYSNFKDFFSALDKDDKLLVEFLDRMTINVSEFFRNYNRWQVLTEKIIPMLFNQRKLECWSSACSTGEEPYTLSMILQHHYPNTPFHILATDLDEIALQKAKDGIYFERSLKEVPDYIKNKYFSEANHLFYVTPEVKKNIEFKKIDLLVDSFAKEYDIIICRNVMIYFTEEAKHLLYQKFSKALKPGGVLFVGSTEQIFNPSQYDLQTVDNFFYRKIN